MKRLNPQTGQPFKLGDKREDGRLFLQYYTTRIKKDGFFSEHWCTAESFEKAAMHRRKYLTSNKISIYAQQRDYAHINRTAILNYKREHYQNNIDLYNAYSAKRRSSKMQRTPSWLTKDQLTEIEEFYTISQMFRIYTGEEYHVDHIVPLQGDNVSGLHVPWNLQVVHWKENLSKGNKHE